MRTRLFAAVLLLPLLALAMETGGIGLRCRVTGVILDACCCGDAADADPAETVVASVSPASCCDRVTRDVARAPAELSVTGDRLTTPPAAITVAKLDSAEVGPGASTRVSCAGTPESVGPPTVRLRLVAKSSFLI
ncbi:MAG TPA: hypothetical protein VHU40_13245 [Polyangia bacterium]|nr:hypothetical protein [Polyangia bacterium]